jgi:predicted metal-binding membrane protein
MARKAQWPEAWLVALGLICSVAWVLLGWNAGSLMLAALCSTSPQRAIPLSVSFDLALAFKIPAHLASEWALMIVAMMPPLIITSLQHIRNRSFARRRTWATVLFVMGYAVVWMTAGIVLQVMVFAARLALPPLVRFAIAGTTASVWQISPAKQWFLNRCHRRPELAAFGIAADRDVFAFGLTHGASCAGSCWALMVLTLFGSQGHIVGMFAVTLFAFGERFEVPAAPAWRWRGPGTALRIAAARVKRRRFRSTRHPRQTA